MASRTITKNLFTEMIKNGAINLKNNYREIDQLNVFPVPDGDTGTNMQMTIMAGVKEILNHDDKNSNISDLSKILSKAVLFGARGNSGVILSQFFRGFNQGLDNVKKDEITVSEFINALKGSCKAAYKAVLEPVEGTILTVMKRATDAVVSKKKELKTVEDCIDLYVTVARETLNKTPEMLPVLKEAGVVDSGGAGFLKIIEGMQMYLRGEVLVENERPQLSGNYSFEKQAHEHQFAEKNIVFGYCTEFIVKLFDSTKFDEANAKKQISKMGDSMVVAVVDDLLKVHVHTNQPGIVITLAQKYGDLQTIKVENMRLQHQHILDDQKQTKQEVKREYAQKYGIIAVCSGEGIADTFTKSGAHYIISGGQTMNPSTEEFVKAIESLDAEHIIIIPNNSNVILAAEQTKNIFPNRDIYVVKAKNIAQGYASMMLFDEFIDASENVETMNAAISEVGAGEVTYAVRDTVVNGVKIKKGDFIGIANSKIKVSCAKRLDCFKKLVAETYTKDRQLLTIFYGKDILKDELDQLTNYLQNKYSDIELELINGNQDIYSYIIVFE